MYKYIYEPPPSGWPDAERREPLLVADASRHHEPLGGSPHLAVGHKTQRGASPTADQQQQLSERRTPLGIMSHEAPLGGSPSPLGCVH